MEHIPRIQAAAEKVAGVPLVLADCVGVEETSRGKPWKGAVMTFTGSNGITVYGWAAWKGDAPQYVAVPREPPVDGPHDAVRSWLAGAADEGESQLKE